MKNIKIILLSFLFTSVFSGVVIFSSCTKTSCSGITCQNGGTCSAGKCVCPTGFSGARCQTRASSAIQYKNNTYTPITIVVNGDTKTIPVGGVANFTGQFGTAALGTASTSGSASSLGISTPAGIIGLTINWAIDNTFPSTDTLRVPLDVGATYFFLRMANTGSTNIINYYVNVTFPYGEFYQDVTVPNTGTTYNLGYYLAYPSSNVQTQSSNSVVTWKPVTLPFTSNQSFTVTIN